MKKITSILTLILFSTLLFSQVESEPNNSFNQSNTINFGDVIQAFIGEAGDDDYFDFFVPESGMIKLTVQNVPDNIDLHAVIYNSNLPPSVIHRNKNSDNGVGYIIWVSTCQVGNHYLFLEDGGAGSGGGSQYNDSIGYSFIVEFTSFASLDECECENESFSTACPIGLGEMQNALIAPWFEFPIGNNIPTKDKDFYKFMVSEPSIVKLQVFNVPDNIDLDAFFYTPSEVQIWSDYTNNDGQGYTISLSTCEIGEHYLYFRDGGNVANGGNDFNALQQYTFRIDTIHFSTIDSYECNNSFNSAFSINICDTIEALINPWFGFNDDSNIPVRDEDFYQIELTSGDEANIIITSVPTDVELCVTIYDSFQNPIGNFSGNSGQPLNVNFTVSDDGVYYIKVEDCDSNFDGEDQYIMTVGCNLISAVSDLGLNGEIQIYPNPFNDNITISFGRLQEKEVEINIVDLLGRSMFFERTSAGNIINIDTENLPKGLLILNLKSGDVQYSVKMTKI